MNRNRMFLILTASVLSVFLFVQACAELPPSAASVETENAHSSAEASSSGEVNVETGSGFWGGPGDVTVEVTNTATAEAEGSGDASATATSSTTVTVTTGDGFDPFAPLPFPPYIPPYHPHHSSSGSSSTRKIETSVKSETVTGTGYTLKDKVNVRALASIYSTRAAVIRNSGTRVEITEEVLNSSGETGYAVKLYNGTLGYILGSLLHADITPAASEEETDQILVKYVYLTPEPVAEVTPEVIYVTVEPAPTPTPIYVYVTPAPAVQEEIPDDDDTING